MRVPGAPSAWVIAHATLIPNGAVLDLASGLGRHARWLAERGHSVVAVDRDAEALATMAGVPGIECRHCDLEGEHWALSGERYAGIVVTNYLFRPRMAELAQMLAPGGVLIYETFMHGQQRFGRPHNPDFLLAPDELKQWALAHGLEVLAFGQGDISEPRAMCVQHLCARRPVVSVCDFPNREAMR
nr:class I SAM-dependent methyltransferase [Niveibacterium umoris]